MRAAFILLATLLAIVGYCGCGSSGDETETAARTSEASSASSSGQNAFVIRAEPICAKAVAEIHSLSRDLPEAIRQAATPGDPIVGALVEPGIEILSTESARLRGLRPASGAPALETYLGLFDPIIELAHQRAEIEVTVDSSRVRDLELLITELGHEQAKAAHELGLQNCAVNFTQALGGAQ